MTSQWQQGRASGGAPGRWAAARMGDSATPSILSAGALERFLGRLRGAAPVRAQLAVAAAVALAVVCVVVWRAATAEGRQRRAHAAAIGVVLESERQLRERLPDQALRYRDSGMSLDDAISRTSEEYLRAVDSLDLRACPPEFQEAFLRFRRAFRDYHDLTEQYGGWSGKIGGAAEFLITGENPALRFQAAMDTVNEHYLVAEQVALRYGVQPGVR